jgi:hypothetical protein
LHLLFELADLVANTARLRLSHIGLSPVCRLQGAKISRDALINLLQACFDFSASKVPVAIIDGFELATVDGHYRT